MSFLTALAVLTVGTAPDPVAVDWPQWRGPKNDGHSPATGLPAKWTDSEGVVWKCKLPGTGASTPCVAGGKLFMTCQDGADIVLVCVSDAGKVEWKKALGTSKATFRGDEGNLASASPSTDGKLVYAFSGTGKVAAFDFGGSEVWGFDAKERYGEFRIQYGIHQTPVLYNGRLYLTLLHRAASLIVALDATTGKEVWKATRTSDGKGESPDVYASAFMWTKGDKSLLIVHGNDYCTAHKIDDGSEVWRVAELNPKARYNMTWRAVSSPLVTPDLIVVPSCKSGVTVGLDPSKASGTILPGTPGELWRLPRNTPDVPSPVLVDGIVYLMGERGTLYAHDAKNGEKLYEEPIAAMRHRACPLYADGKLYLLGRDKRCVVVKPGKTYEKIAVNDLPDTFTASPVAVGNRLYLRGFEYLWAIGSK